MAGPMGKAVSFQGGGDTYEVREVFEVEEEVEVDEDGNELPPRASSKPAARGGARGEATAASKERTAAAATEAAMAEGRSDAAKRAVSAARHEALKRISSEKAAGVAARFARSVSLSPNELLPFTLVAKLREGHSGPVTRAVWADDARHIASCALDGSVAVWDTRTCMVRRQYTGHHGPVRTVAFSPVGDNDRLASAGHDHTVRLWAKRSGKQLFTFREQRCGVRTLAFCRDGSLLATGADDGSVFIYNMEKLERDAMEKSAAPVEAPEDLSRDRLEGAAMLMVSLEHFPERAEGHGGAVLALAWSAKDSYVASAGSDRVVKVWTVAGGGNLAHDLVGHTGPVTGLAFSPDPHGARLASVSEDGTLRLWEWQKGTALAVFKGQHMGGISCVCWPPEGEGGRIITGGEDRSVVCWAARDGALLQLMAGIHTHAVTSVDMSPDGLHLITGAADATVGLWGPVPLSNFELLVKRCGAALGWVVDRVGGGCLAGASATRAAVAPAVSALGRGAVAAGETALGGVETMQRRLQGGHTGGDKEGNGGGGGGGLAMTPSTRQLVEAEGKALEDMIVAKAARAHARKWAPEKPHTPQPAPPPARPAENRVHLGTPPAL